MEERKIFTYWEQGFDQAPPVVAKCLNQMRELHPEWAIHELDKISIRSLVGERPVSDEVWESLGLAHRSDLLRTQLLIRHGGVWMDPTVFCTRTLDNWLPAKMGAGVFFFQKPGPDRLISNWFIAAEAGNLILVRLLDRLRDFWEKEHLRPRHTVSSSLERFVIRILSRHHALSRWRVREPWRRMFSTNPYMLYHYLLCDLIMTDKAAKQVWRQVPFTSALPPHRLQRLGLSDPITREGEALLRGEGSPLFKLTWKGIPSNPEAGTLLRCLYDIAQTNQGVA